MKKGETIKSLTFIIVLALFFYLVYLGLTYIFNSNKPIVTPTVTQKETFGNKKNNNKPNEKKKNHIY
jgi:hypothetical protein